MKKTNRSAAFDGLEYHALCWLLAAYAVFMRPFGDGIIGGTLNAFPVLLMVTVSVACWRVSARPTQRAGSAAPAPALGPRARLLAVLGSSAVAVGLTWLLVPGIAGLAIIALEWLASLGQERAPVDAIPIEQLLVPAVDGLVRVSQWLLVPGVASSVAYGWRQWALARRY